MFMIGGIGLSPNAFAIGGVAPPNESPPATSSEPSRTSLRYSSNHVSRNAAPAIENVGPTAVPVGSPSGPMTKSADSGVPGGICPCQSLMFRIVISRKLPFPLMILKRILPRAFCGPGMPRRNAIVGATSIARTAVLAAEKCRMPGPAATNVPCMLMFRFRSTKSGR